MSMTIVVGLLMVVGLIGVVVPVIPGLAIVMLGTVLWAADRGDVHAWLVVGAATVLYAAGLVTRYALPGRRMRRAGVRPATLVLALVAAVAGFVVVPVVGAPIGFVLGVYLVELAGHRDHGRARAATMAALEGVVTSAGIELVTGFAIVLIWVVGLLTLGVGP
ncbi:DUF456 domain-containing protein [Lapillicoccus sp.]|uniref:DUF456 domain-containing protein n=1 Tax=Lapillicoccus sp. TaxID=1909287 RepID=UPI0025E63198|nr:DUF456 domain-containing protein [Lapillicoccus sp.]